MQQHYFLLAKDNLKHWGCFHVSNAAAINLVKLRAWEPGNAYAALKSNLEPQMTPCRSLIGSHWLHSTRVCARALVCWGRVRWRAGDFPGGLAWRQSCHGSSRNPSSFHPLFEKRKIFKSGVSTKEIFHFHNAYTNNPLK